VDLIQKNAFNDGFAELTKLMTEKKITYQCMPLQSIENAENTPHGK
jgi:hypothetical protein